MKIILSIVAIISVPIFTYSTDLSSIGLPEWDSMPVYQKAELMLQTKAEASKSKDGSENYMHIQTLISLSSPLTAEQNKELVKNAVDILQKHPEWGNIKPPPPVIQPPAIVKQQSPISETVPSSVPTEDATAVLTSGQSNNNIPPASAVNPQNNTQDNIANTQDQKQNLEDALQKYNEQKKLIVTAVPENKTKNKKQVVVTTNNEQNKNLFTDGDFPTGQYYKTEHLDNLPFTKEYKSIYYFIEPLIIDYPINNSFICHLDESTKTQISSFFLREKRQFQITFPFPTPYLKKDSTVFFSLTYPLTIKGKVQYKDTTGDMITKYICEYQGKSLHAIK